MLSHITTSKSDTTGALRRIDLDPAASWFYVGPQPVRRTAESDISTAFKLKLPSWYPSMMHRSSGDTPIEQTDCCGDVGTTYDTPVS